MAMATILRIPGILWRISLALVLIRIPLSIFGISYPPVLNLADVLILFMFLDISFWIGMGQIFGSLYAKIAYGSKLPSVDNYDCKVDYILPFEGKFSTVGLTKNFPIHGA